MKNKKVYIRLIITYLIVFLIPLVLNVFTLEEIARSTQDSICQGILVNMEHAGEILDNNFEELDAIVQKLTGNSTVRYIATQMEKKNKYIDISKLLSVQNYMESMRLQTFVEEYYLLFHNTDMIISPEHIFLDQDNCKYFFQYDGVSWEEWREQMEGTYNSCFFPEAMTKQNTSRQNMILYVQSLVTGSGAKGTFIFPIKSEALTALLTDNYVAKTGWAYLTDADGQVLAELPSATEEFELIPEEYVNNGKDIQQIRLNGRNVEVIQTASEETGLRFVAVLPREYITAQINEAQRRTVYLILIALVVGIAAILAASWHRGRKIDNILQMLFQAGGDKEEELKGDELAYISHSLNQLIENNTDLKESIKRQKPVIKGMLLERLLLGTGNVTEKSLEEYGICLSGHDILVIAYQIEEGKTVDTQVQAGDTAVYGQMLQNGIDELLTARIYPCELDINEGAIVCALEEEEKRCGEQQFLEALEKLCSTFWEQFGISVRIAVGNVCQDIGKISKSYDQVYEMLQYGAASDKHVFHYRDYVDGREYYYFPVSLEERLVNAVKTGNIESMHDQLKEVYEINVMERSITPSMMHFLVNDLQCAVFKALHGLNHRVDVDEEEIYRQLEQLNRENDILLRFNRINSIFQYLCEKVQEGADESNVQQKEQIERYIRENYHNSDLSLTKIADDFGYASTYFSRLFKELFHENFTAYLEMVRIERVCELLRGGVNLETIAEQTGYNSVYVMRTAFKRSKGMTPNDYRKLNIDKADK